MIIGFVLGLLIVAPARARMSRGWLGWNHAKAAIHRGGERAFPGSHVTVNHCRRLTYRTLACTLNETGYAPFTGADNNPAWSGWLANIRATRVASHRVRIWSPFWGSFGVVRG